MASMRSRSPPRMQTSRSWLSRPARTGGFDADPLVFACECGRLGLRRGWATNDGTVAGHAAGLAGGSVNLNASKAAGKASSTGSDVAVADALRQAGISRAARAAAP